MTSPNPSNNRQSFTLLCHGALVAIAIALTWWADKILEQTDFQHWWEPIVALPALVASLEGAAKPVCLIASTCAYYALELVLVLVVRWLIKKWKNKNKGTRI
jgi:hypothetical protein